jgi:hypothetical protein
VTGDVVSTLVRQVVHLAGHGALEAGDEVLQLDSGPVAWAVEQQVEADAALGPRLEANLRRWFLRVHLPGEGVLEVGFGVEDWPTTPEALHEPVDVGAHGPAGLAGGLVRLVTYSGEV